MNIKKKLATKPAVVKARIVFLKLGTIDTKNEKYDAEAYLECSWEDDQLFALLTDSDSTKPETNEVKMKKLLNNLNTFEYNAEKFWNPMVFVENALGEQKQEIRHKLVVARKGKEDKITLVDSEDPLFWRNAENHLTIRVTEMRKVYGHFYERLELYDFPMDMQEISITLTSKKDVHEVDFVANEASKSGLNTEDFHNQQEWNLCEHVTSSVGVAYDHLYKHERRIFTVTCYITRKPGYYLYNAYMMVFLITVLGFVPFAFNPTNPNFRCQVTGLLLLTSVNFRWVVTQRLPSVAYLTSLDKYAIGNLFCLVLFCVWHSLIGSDVITTSVASKKSIDAYLLYAAATLYFIFNFVNIIWFLKMYLARVKFINENEVVGKESRFQRKPNSAANNQISAHEINGFSLKSYRHKTNNVTNYSQDNVQSNQNSNDPVFLMTMVA